MNLKEFCWKDVIKRKLVDSFDIGKKSLIFKYPNSCHSIGKIETFAK